MRRPRKIPRHPTRAQITQNALADQMFIENCRRAAERYSTTPPADRVLLMGGYGRASKQARKYGLNILETSAGAHENARS